MEFLFKDNSLKSRMISIGIVILFLILSTLLINVLIAVLPIALIGWILYRAIMSVKVHFSNSRKFEKVDIYHADTVTMDSSFEEQLMNKEIIDVEYTEV